MQQSPSEKPGALQIVRKYPTLYGTGRFIAVFTTACHLAPS